MGISQKFKSWLIRRQIEIQKGKSRLEQDKIRRQKQKINDLVNMKPGARKAIKAGLIMKKKPLEVMRDEYERRKYEREKGKNP